MIILRVRKLVAFIVLATFSLTVYASREEVKDSIKIGGALRFNAATQNYESSNNEQDTYFKLDTWFLGVDGTIKGFDISLQYRFYPESKSHFIHHGYIGRSIGEKWYGKLGVFQKPFGISGFASHSWWLQLPYYLGFEDTYSSGVGFTHSASKFKFDIAYFRQAAPKGTITSDEADNSVGLGRYSFAIIPTVGWVDGDEVEASIRELNQFNARLCYYPVPSVELGGSLQMGGIYNSVLNKHNWGFSWAAHADANLGNWNFKGEVVGYEYNATADDGRKLDVVSMGAYGAEYDIAARGMLYVAGVAHTFNVNKPWLKSVQPYVDYSVAVKSNSNFHSCHHLIPGLLLVSGSIFTYVDYAWGKNNPSFTNNYGTGLGVGHDEARWNSRLNINVGYYF